MWPPAITAKFTRSAPTASTRCSSRATKSTFACSRSIPKGNLIAGSDGSGLIYRIAPNGEAFVLYSAPKKEITALAIDSAGNIYAAGAGEKHPGAMFATQAWCHASLAAAAPAPISGRHHHHSGCAERTCHAVSRSRSGATGGSEIYRITPDGAPEHLWTSRDDLVYALGFDQQGRLLAGTGNRGHIFAINGRTISPTWSKRQRSQITAFAPAPGGGLYASSSNLGKIFLLGPGPDSEGSYESDVFDAHGSFAWGRGSMRSAGNVELYARSGNVDNPDRNWSPGRAWIHRRERGAESPPARFVQWKSVLHAGKSAPRVDSVLLYYLPKNVAPEIDEITSSPVIAISRFRVRRTRTRNRPASRISSCRLRPSATAIRSESAGRRTTTTTTSSCIPFTIAATANRAGCC
jgi:hypothetical protein